MFDNGVDDDDADDFAGDVGGVGGDHVDDGDVGVGGAHVHDGDVDNDVDIVDNDQVGDVEYWRSWC